MSYVSLYRKWRPQSFADLAGQQNVVQTLKNAIKLNRIAHAYLFSGPRGTGKTSTAKILAKSLNCEDGPTINPCDECEVCTKINENNSIDVIEIDAASNRGIDEIRELREKVKFSPTEGNYKVYIIDEVHMLTTEAFNALLKTLEEPPEYVIFILATTEPHKLLPTVLSRCQRFDFSRLSIEEIKGRLSYICDQEEVEYSSSALNAIARNAEGGMRDAISILDQTISYSGQDITVDDVASVLGMVDKEVLFELTGVMAAGNVKEGLKTVNQIINQGKDITQFVTDLIYYLRNLLLIKECETVEGLIDLTEETKKQLKNKASQLRVPQILRWIDLLEDLDYDLKQTDQPRVTLEMGMIKLIKQKTDKSLAAILDRVSRLEDLVANKKTVSAKQETKPNKTKDKPSEGVKAKNTEEKDSVGSESVAAKADREVSLEEIQGIWDKVLKDIKQKEITLHSVLKHNTSLQHFKNDELLINLENESRFYKQTLKDGKQTLADSLNKFLGINLQVKYDFSRTNSAGEKKEAEDSVLEHPLVKEAVDVFDGEVIKVSKTD